MSTTAKSVLEDAPHGLAGLLDRDLPTSTSAVTPLQKIAAFTRAEVCAIQKLAAATPGKEIKAPGILRNSASAAWHIGGRTPPKPKSTSTSPPSGSHQVASTAKAKPPSNRAYHKDLLRSLYDPQRGFRIAVTA